MGRIAESHTIGTAFLIFTIMVSLLLQYVMQCIMLTVCAITVLLSCRQRDTYTAGSSK